MKSYKQITYRYLKGQKNRTLLTILGIILSVALISAIGSIIVSARGALIKEAIKDNGSYHGLFENIDKATINKLKNHVEVEKVGITEAQGAAPIAETTQQERLDYGWDIPYRYIEIQGYDEVAKGILPIRLKEGRLPESSDEIIIEYWMKNYFDEEVEIGEKIKLTLGERHIEEEENEFGDLSPKRETFKELGVKEYTVVGFIQPRYVWRGNLVTKGITGLDMEKNKNNKYGAYFILTDIKNAQEKIYTIGEDLGVYMDNIFTNNRLLRLSAESVSDTFNDSITGLLIFVITLIVISTMAVIYNAFNISVLERISQFGLLRSVGATPNQIRGIVLKEASILSAIGIPIGLFSGVFAMKVVLYIIGLLKSDFELINDMEITISGTVFLISTIVGIFTVFLSAMGPTIQAGRVSPLEAVKNTGDIKKENFKGTKNILPIRKVLGVEGEIAYKNLRRNKKRFLITVFSMVISIALFITFSTFSDFMFKVGAVDTGEMGDFSLFGHMENRQDEIITHLKSMEDVNRIYRVSQLNGEVLLKDNQISKKIIEDAPYMFNEKNNGLTKIHNVEISTLGDENLEVLKRVLKSGSIDIDKINKEKGVLVINSTLAYKENSNARTLMEGYNLKVGDKIPFAPYHLDMGENIEYEELTVVGVLEKGILGDGYNLNGSINMITTEEIWNQIYEGEDPSKTPGNPYIDMHIEMTKDGNRENIGTYLKKIEEEMPSIHYIDRVEQAKENRKVNIIMSIFLYGFVTIIALISVINIINTISTNIILRTREIAMIKAVGMTQSGIKRMVAYESLFYGLYAAIFGGTIGVGLSYILFRIVIGISEFEYQIPWQNTVIACIGAAIIALISGAYPLKRINDKIIVESMKIEN